MGEQNIRRISDIHAAFKEAHQDGVLIIAIDINGTRAGDSIALDGPHAFFAIALSMALYKGTRSVQTLFLAIVGKRRLETVALSIFYSQDNTGVFPFSERIKVGSQQATHHAVEGFGYRSGITVILCHRASPFLFTLELLCLLGNLSRAVACLQQFERALFEHTDLISEHHHINPAPHNEHG